MERAMITGYLGRTTMPGYLAFAVVLGYTLCNKHRMGCPPNVKNSRISPRTPSHHVDA
jgi:hypothetical protein